MCLRKINLLTTMTTTSSIAAAIKIDWISRLLLGAIFITLFTSASSHLHIGVPEGTIKREFPLRNSSLILIQIRNYWKCFESVTVTPESATETDNDYCPATFDGWGCWNATWSGNTAQIPCFSLVSDAHNKEIATKKCINGKWEMNLETGEEKVDYSRCNLNMSMGSPDLLFEVIEELNSLETSPYIDRAIAEAFERCLNDVLVMPSNEPSKAYCRRTFDGWGCWNDTAAGMTAYIPCPNFITGFLPERQAHKECNEDGTWFRHPITERIWSNYTTCIDKEDLSFRQRINNLYISGYTISVIALVTSLGIFCYFRSLQCTRIVIHKNLFVSFIINNITWIVWYTEVVQKPSVLVSNEIPCQVLHVIVHYFLVSNYLWMFCEGLYLHTLLLLTFVNEEKLLKWFYTIGWGVPLVIITSYVLARVKGGNPGSTLYCWIEESSYSWIISGPVCASILINFIFLINIVRVLVTKLQAVNSPDTHQTRKAVRATLILLPLLGLNYLVTPFRPLPKSTGEAVYETISAIVTSYQGLMVALLFCFFNTEILKLIKNKWNRTFGEKSQRKLGATAVSSMERKK